MLKNVTSIAFFQFTHRPKAALAHPCACGISASLHVIAITCNAPVSAPLTALQLLGRYIARQLLPALLYHLRPCRRPCNICISAIPGGQRACYSASLCLVSSTLTSTLHAFDVLGRTNAASAGARIVPDNPFAFPTSM